MRLFICSSPVQDWDRLHPHESYLDYTVDDGWILTKQEKNMMLLEIKLLLWSSDRHHVDVSTAELQL